MSASKLPIARHSKTGSGPYASGARAPSHPAGEPSLALGRYRLIRRLGAGAFGTVWMAHDERLEREVAVKIVPRERVLGGRLEREARAAARLSHPGIVTLYEAAVDDDAAYLVSELVRGRTLQQLLAGTRLSDRDVVVIASSLCGALSHAHAHGVVHRDVKPSNVLVAARPSSPSHPAKLTDFGVARVIGGDSLTRTGDVVGTAAYMAPEQAEGREAGATADLYSLALVTYEALTGVNPIRTGTAAIRARRLGAYLPPLRRHRRDLPRELGWGIDLALRPRPRERGTLDELHESLSVALEQVSNAADVGASAWRPRRARAEREEAVAGNAAARDIAAEEGFARDWPAPATARDWPAPAAVPDTAPGWPAPDTPPDTPSATAPATAPDWPARAAAATAAAATVGWLSSHLLAPSSIPALGAAMLAWLLVVALPRVGWFTVTTTLAVAAALQDRPGGAILLLLAALIPALLMPRRGTCWPLGAIAPALGLVGLGGAWPALAARITTSAWRRAAVAATGWLWLVLAAPLADADLYTAQPPGTPRPEVWASSVGTLAQTVIRPIVTSGLLAGALVWGLAAVVLPWLVTGRSLPRDIVFVSAWAAMTVSATEAAIAIASSTHTVSAPPTATAGAVVGALVAIAPSAREAWQQSRKRVNPGPELP